ncbi:MAG: outer membrane beta-barrel protein [Akkermansia sp.]|nr:outer membrane beta-barrel protein [Akkermansia sp.]MBR2313665.1 outer membrane beta-barrel protein [Akkermansia sp.]
MKKTLLTALLAACCVIPAVSAGESISTRSIGIGYEYSSYNVENSDWTMNSAVIRGNYDFYKFNNGITVTLTGSAYYGIGEIDDDIEPYDTTRMGVKAGLLFNYSVSDKLTIFAGPTIGYNVFSYDTPDLFKNATGAELDDDTGVTYGVTAGLRYLLSNQKTSIEVGISVESTSLSGADDEYDLGGETLIKWSEDSIGSTSLYIGINHAF